MAHRHKTETEAGGVRPLAALGSATLILLAVSLAPLSLAAQVDIESLRLGGQDDGFLGRGSFNFSVREGNVSLTMVSLSGRAEYVRKASTTLLVARGDMAWKSGSRFSNQALLHLRETLRTDRTLQPEIFTQVDYAKPRALDFRVLIGAGPRLQLAADDHRRLAVAVAYMFEREELTLPPGSLHPILTSSHRLSSYVTGAYRSGTRFTVSGTVYAQPRLDAWEDYRILGDGSLRVGLTTSLAVNLALSLRYDSEPPDGRDGLDLRYSSGLSIEF